jgi:hypothetical protein
MSVRRPTFALRQLVVLLSTAAVAASGAHSRPKKGELYTIVTVPKKARLTIDCRVGRCYDLGGDGPGAHHSSPASVRNGFPRTSVMGPTSRPALLVRPFPAIDGRGLGSLFPAWVADFVGLVLSLLGVLAMLFGSCHGRTQDFRGRLVDQ